jgi:hypothetical protein
LPRASSRWSVVIRAMSGWALLMRKEQERRGDVAGAAEYAVPAILPVRERV